jgi:chromosome segregation ATPase
MSETNLGNEQAESRPGGVRREEGSGEHQPDSDGSEALRSAGGSDRHQSQRIDRTASARANQFQSRGQIAGGILRQLIVKADSQLAKVEDRLQQLEIERQKLEEEREQAQQEREQLQTLLENLQQTIQENP